MTAPERIWLQDNGDFDAASEVTWCQHSIDDADTEYVRADLAAVQPAQVRVKPLVWTTRSGAPTAFGNYIVTCEDHDDVTVWFVLFGGKPLARCGEHRTEYAAKSAAQADYEARIFAVLEPQPDPRDEVIKGLMEALENRLHDPECPCNACEPMLAALAAAKAVLK